MVKIEFYLEGELLGTGEVREGSTNIDRKEAAKLLGINYYDEFRVPRLKGITEFISSKDVTINGEVYCDFKHIFNN